MARRNDPNIIDPEPDLRPSLVCLDCVRDRRPSWSVTGEAMAFMVAHDNHIVIAPLIVVWPS